MNLKHLILSTAVMFSLAAPVLAMDPFPFPPDTWPQVDTPQADARTTKTDVKILIPPSKKATFIEPRIPQPEGVNR